MMSSKRDVSLYLHIPFCIRKCAYCDFLSGPVGESDREDYVTALIRELELTALEYKSQYSEKPKVPSVFFGGGTPSLLKPDQLGRILDTIHESYDLSGDAEVTMEMNPGTVTEELLQCAKKNGINRLSVGLQSADNKELLSLGRIHSWEDFAESWNLIKAVGFTNCNLDLMSGIPGQTEKSWEETLDKVISLRPEHISAYSLIVEEGTPFYDLYKDWDNEDLDRKLYHRTKQRLKEAGYERYEISNYARPGFECRHNLRYWQGGDYLGFGIGAASLYNGRRYSNLRSREKYIRTIQSGELNLLQEETEIVTEKAAMEEFCFLGLRCMQGISPKEFEERFSVNFERIYGDTVSKFLRQGLLEQKVLNSDPRLILTEQGIDLSNQVLAEFLLD